MHVDFKDVHWGQTFRFFSLGLEQGHMRMELCLGILQIFWSCTAELSAAYSCWPFWLGKWRISLPPLQVSVQYCDPHYSFATSNDKQVYFNLCFGYFYKKYVFNSFIMHVLVRLLVSFLVFKVILLNFITCYLRIWLKLAPILGL